MSDETQEAQSEEAPQEEVSPATEWTQEIGRLFGIYNRQIIELSGQKAEIEFSIGQVANSILKLCPELIQRKGDGQPESVCDCAVRLITEYVELRKKMQGGEGTVPEVAGSEAGDPGQGAAGDGAPDPGLGSESQPG